MKHGSLFSGIGGFDLASEWMGWENVFHCEWNPFGQKVLNYYWPNAITYHDITKTDFTIHRGRIDIITGGFPCQPYSSAGKRLGKEDERHLWPEMLRAIREIQPTWIVGENVRGLTNWNGGLVFDEVQSDLEAQGYEVTPFLLPAASVNAPHRRDRIWFVAYSESARTRKNFGGIWGLSDRYCKGVQNATNSKPKGLQGYRNPREVSSEEGTLGGKRSQSPIDFASVNKESNATNSESWRQGGVSIESKKTGTRKGDESPRSVCGFSQSNNRKRNQWQNFPTVSPICDGNDGLSDRLDRITFSKWRNESIKAGGNAVVPQVVYQIFKAIEKYNELDKQLTI